MANERDQDLLDRLCRSVPRLEPSPYFAVRVARCIQLQGGRTLFGTIAQVAHRLVPIMTAASVCFVVGVVLLAPASESPSEDEVQLSDLFPSQLETNDIMLEDLVASAAPPRDNNGNPSD